MIATVDIEHCNQIHLAQRFEAIVRHLRWPQYRQRFWCETLSDEERAKIGFPGDRFPDPISTWAQLKTISLPEAALELAVEFEMLSERECERLHKIAQPHVEGRASNSRPRERGRPNKLSGRRMVRSELLGKPTHCAGDGTGVHIWKRDGKYIARGSIRGRRFGVTLGESQPDAEAELRRLLVAIEDGTFVRSTEAKALPLPNSKVPLLTVEQLCNRFVGDVRGTRGKETAGTYLSRLQPLIAFAERAEIKQRWPLAGRLDRAFVVEFRKFLFQRRTSRNGHPAAEEVPASTAQVFNVLDCCRTMINWALNPQVRNLPLGMMNPFTAELLGTRPSKDPLRGNPFPLQERQQLIAAMDAWELCQFAIPFVLPLRPDELAGLLVTDVDLGEQVLNFETRLGGGDFNKARLSFRIPFPAALLPILRRCMLGRESGPLLLKRRAAKGPEASESTDVSVMFRGYLQRAKPTEVQTEQDQKRLFRRMLSELGGMTERSYRAAFRDLLIRSSIDSGQKPYALRSAITTEMRRLRFDPDVLLYVTCHEPNRRNIVNHYAGVDVNGEMNRYFEFAEPLLVAITNRAGELGLR